MDVKKILNINEPPTIVKGPLDVTVGELDSTWTHDVSVTDPDAGDAASTYITIQSISSGFTAANTYDEASRESGAFAMDGSNSRTIKCGLLGLRNAR